MVPSYTALDLFVSPSVQYMFVCTDCGYNEFGTSHFEVLRAERFHKTSAHEKEGTE